MSRVVRASLRFTCCREVDQKSTVVASIHGDLVEWYQIPGIYTCVTCRSLVELSMCLVSHSSAYQVFLLVFMFMLTISLHWPWRRQCVRLLTVGRCHETLVYFNSSAAVFALLENMTGTPASTSWPVFAFSCVSCRVETSRSRG